MLFSLLTVCILCIALTVLLLKFNSKLNNDLFSGAKSYHWFFQYVSFWLLFKKSIPIALLDIDNFKEINAFGIHYGDNALKEFVKFSKQHLPQYSIARYRHGDEFVVISLQNNCSKLESDLKLLNEKLLCKKVDLSTLHKMGPLQFKFHVDECKRSDNLPLFLMQMEENLMKKKAIR